MSISISTSGFGSTSSVINSSITTSGNNLLYTNTNSKLNVKNHLEESVINVDNDGYCVVNKLALLDEVTGRRWQVKVSNGQLLVEPVELVDKRDYKIEQVLK